MNEIQEQKLWEKCVAFHGHSCAGLMIGFKAALYARKQLDLHFSEDEDTACISENDACGVDAIQVLLGCSIGKGNLMFHMTGKQAFTFFNRKNDRSVRLILKPRPDWLKKGTSFSYYQSCAPEEMFLVKPAVLMLPEKARSFRSILCSDCGEETAENYIRLDGEKKLCPDCYKSYSRFDIR